MLRGMEACTSGRMGTLVCAYFGTDSKELVGVRTLRIISFGNFAAVVSGVTGQNSLRGVGVSQNPFL